MGYVCLWALSVAIRLYTVSMSSEGVWMLKLESKPEMAESRTHQYPLDAVKQGCLNMATQPQTSLDWAPVAPKVIKLIIASIAQLELIATYSYQRPRGSCESAGLTNNYVWFRFAPLCQ